MKNILLAAALAIASLSATAQTKEGAIGCWKMPSRAGENLQLNRDGSFSFNDYNTMTKATENLYGTWKMSGTTVTLMYEDRPQQRFALKKDKSGKMLLTKAGGFQFVKGTPAECTAQQ